MSDYKRYILTSRRIEVDGHELYQIRGCAGSGHEGEDGGWIESEDNLDQDSAAWVAGQACVYGDARVTNKAFVYGKAIVHDRAVVCGDAEVYDEAEVCGDARVEDQAQVYGTAIVKGDAIIGKRESVYEGIRDKNKVKLKLKLKSDNRELPEIDCSNIDNTKQLGE